VDGEISSRIGDWGADTPWTVVVGTWCITYWVETGDLSITVLSSLGSALTLNNWEACLPGSYVNL
jgi:hypothetical protein